MKYKELRRLWKEKMIIVCKSCAWRLYVLIWRVKNRDLHVASQRSYHVKYSWDFDTFTNVVKIFFQIWLKRNSMKNRIINKQENRWTCSFGLIGLRCPKGLRLICRLSKCMLILFNQLIKVSSCYVGQNEYLLDFTRPLTSGRGSERRQYSLSGALSLTAHHLAAS